MRRALAVALALLALLPQTASAHALLQETTPERGARLDAAPEQVTLRFSEPVEIEFGAVRVFDSEGQEVQEGAAFHPGDRSAEVGVRLEAGLPEAGYTVTYRVISADSHPVSGGFVFVVGDAAAPSTTVGELLGDAETGPVTGTAFGVARAIQFAAIALALGVVTFALWCWLPVQRRGWAPAAAAFTGRQVLLLRVAAVVGVLSAVAGILFQGAVAAGSTFWSAIDPDVVGDVLGTRFGVFWAAGIVAWLLVLVLARHPRALVLPVAALAALPALGGHAGVQSPVALLLPANVLHVLAMGAWLGGVAVLVLAVRAATARLDAGERTPLLATVVARFSTLAGVAIAALLASGIVQSLVLVRSVPHLVDTPFGRAVLIKIVVFSGIVALGWINRQRLLPALRKAAAGGGSPGRAGLLLRRTLRAELALGIVALGATGALAGYAPSIAESTGPFSANADIGPARMEMTVDPARVGPNEIHMYLFDRSDGSQYDETKELTVTAELPEKRIDRIELDATKAGPGHYVVSGAALGVAGEWTVEVAARVTDFDEYRTEVKVPVR